MRRSFHGCDDVVADINEVSFNRCSRRRGRQRSDGSETDWFWLSRWGGRGTRRGSPSGRTVLILFQSLLDTMCENEEEGHPYSDGGSSKEEIND